MDRKKIPAGDAVRKVIVPKAAEQIRLRNLDTALLKSQWKLPDPQPAPGPALERNVLEYNRAMCELYDTVVHQMSGDFAHFASSAAMPAYTATATILGKSLPLRLDAPDMRLLHCKGWQEFQEGSFPQNGLFPGKKSMSGFLASLEYRVKTRIFDVIKKLEQVYMGQIHSLEHKAMARKESQPFEIFMAGIAIKIPLSAFINHAKDEEWFARYREECLIGRYEKIGWERFGGRHPEFSSIGINN